MNHVLNVEDLLQEISPEAPCGADPEGQPDFIEMEQAAQGKPERQMGESVLPAEDGDWRTVKTKALALFQGCKDLRVGVYLARALVKVDGPTGLHDGLDLVRGLLEQHWGSVHPELDPEDDHDPTIRVNTLLNLCGNEEMVRPIREMELVSVKGLGRYSLQDYLVADGKLPAPTNPDAPLPGKAEIEAAFTGCELEDLQEKAEAAKATIGLVASIETSLLGHVGPTNAVGLDSLTDVLKELDGVLSAQLANRGVADPDAPAAEGEAAPAQSVSGEVRSREDVIRVLDKACDYFQRNEPSSPVPLLLKRAKSLVAMDFMDIVRDLAPGGVPEAEKVLGKEPE